jgi:prepilin-type N-terminal cleavage/methylation domain-containing protein
MTTDHTILRRMRPDAGFTIIELLIATSIMLVVTGSVFSMLNPSQGIFQTQPEVADVQQRLRVGVDTIQKDLIMAGAGTYLGAAAGALTNFFAPVMPFRIGEIDSDQAKGIYYRPDTISVMYVPPSPAQTRVVKTLGNNSAEIDVEPQINCADEKKNGLCGFEDGMRVIIFDPSGSFDWMTITQVQPSALHLQHNRDKLSSTYGADAALTQVATHTYYLKSDDTTKTWQLRHYDGDQIDLPVLDDVVKLEFQYFGEPQPPRLLPGAVLSAQYGPWTTYGPKPPVLGVDRTSDTWGKGENCVFQVDPVSGLHAPRLPVLANGDAQVELTADMLQDGPWCPDESKTEKWDADLLRIRRIRVNLRVQVGKPTLRGPASVLFAKGGTSTGGYKLVPDQEIRFDVAPRNMNLGR